MKSAIFAHRYSARVILNYRNGKYHELQKKGIHLTRNENNDITRSLRRETESTCARRRTWILNIVGQQEEGRL